MVHGLQSSQGRYWRWIALSWLIVSVVVRSLLLGWHWQDIQHTPGSLLGIYLSGLVYDLSFIAYASVPLWAYLLLCPERLWKSRWNTVFLNVAFALNLFVALFASVSELIFWDEFSVRFNFIAVDYLVYSDEVLNNILESYPVYPILSLLLLLATFTTFLSRRRLWQVQQHTSLSGRERGQSALWMVALLATVSLVVGQEFPRTSEGNVYQRELASNGPFQFFSAFRNNEIDYDQFYRTLSQEQIAQRLQQELAEPEATPVVAGALDLRRRIDSVVPQQPLNVVLVVVESLSAKYLGSFGDPRGLTPNLDALRSKSLTFTNFYATGTRTTRGLEAVTLSIPPTPGRSIVKRIGRESGFASLGQQLSDQGYDSVFLYGGRGYFDNMSAFFEGNGYRVIDQSAMPEEQIQFSNAWGVSDEDLYRQAMQVADQDYSEQKPFFLQLMTTSNHRPYTYPEGRIDIPSGDGREGAVKYTDYAIGQFLAQAQEKPWFDQTVFVFVADHTAGSAGKQDLPVEQYHIPLFIYAPKQIAAGEFTEVASQVDLAPTLLGLLGVDYVSAFFGHDLLNDGDYHGRALIGNYQHLGLFDGNDLVILSPRKAARLHQDALGLSTEQELAEDDPRLERAIAYYQGASYAFKHGLMAWSQVQAAKPVPLSQR